MVTKLRRRGVSRVGLLVLIVILGLLVGCAAVVMLRQQESARRMRCTKNLKMIGIALQGHIETHGAYPPGLPSCTEKNWIQGGVEEGAVCQGPNWASLILGNMAETLMYEQLFESMKTDRNAAAETEAAPGNLGRTTPRFYVCPSAYAMSPENRIATYGFKNISKGNYAACWGSDTYMSFENPNTAGVFGVVMLPGYRDHDPKGTWKMGHKWGTRTIGDGAHNTLAVSEVLGYDSKEDGRGGWVLNAMGASAFTARYGPNAEQDDHVPMCEEQIDEKNPLHCTENRKDGGVWASARSRHPGGVNAATCDGAVRFFSDTIELEVWRALSTRSGPKDEPRSPE
ncbi:MAG: DUF1559 domain-containing protein [Candidatus Nealsonbacteria bacterium]|nr:DUF1559 domain-containing protein [Candidatus Nealsonbacteria bacterium]